MPSGRLGQMCQKTKMCKFFLVEMCTKGELCSFAHNRDELQQAPDLSRTKLCPAVASGRACGNRMCAFAHSRRELRRVVLECEQQEAQSGDEDYDSPPGAQTPCYDSPQVAFAAPASPPLMSVPPPMMYGEQVPPPLMYGQQAVPPLMYGQQAPAPAMIYGDQVPPLMYGVPAAAPAQAVVSPIMQLLCKVTGVSLPRLQRQLAEQEPDVRQTGGAAAAKLYRDVLAGVAGGEFGDTLPLGLSRMSTEQEDEAEEFMSGTTSGASSVIESPINVPSAPSPAQVSARTRGATAQGTGGAAAAAGAPTTEEPVSRNKFRKTKMCKFFEAGKCRKRTSCNFAHSEAEMKPLPDLRRTKLCPSVLEGGVCEAGEDCGFAHTEAELRASRRSSEAPAPAPGPGGEPSPHRGGYGGEASPTSPMPEALSKTMEPPEGMSLRVKHTFLTIEPDEGASVPLRRTRSAPALEAPTTEEVLLREGGQGPIGRREGRTRMVTEEMLRALIANQAGQAPPAEPGGATDAPRGDGSPAAAESGAAESRQQRGSSPPPRKTAARPAAAPWMPTLGVGSADAPQGASTAMRSKAAKKPTPAELDALEALLFAAIENATWARTSSL